MENILAQVVAVFAEEAKDLSAVVERGLLRVVDETVPNLRQTLLAEVLRAIHTMKGSASSLGLVEVESLSHVAETALQRYRDGVLPVPASLAHVVMGAFDASLAHVQAVAQHRTPTDLSGWQQQLSQADAPAARPTPSAPLPPVPMPAPPPSSPDGPNPSVPPMSSPSISGPGELESVRIAVEQVARLESSIDRLRESRGALQGRVKDLDRVVAALDRAAHVGLDRVTTKALRAQVATAHRSLFGDVMELDAQLSDLDEELRVVRQVPLETALRRVERAIKSHAHSVNKRVRLVVNAPQLSLDRRVLEELREMLLHLGRNAVDHGVESAKDRALAGKPEVAVLTLVVEPAGETLRVTLADDGRGIDDEKLRATMVSKGLVNAAQAAQLAPEVLRDFLFLPGVSTADQVSLTSGRGVGLDVVREKAKDLGGRVELTSEKGRGTTFILELPSSVATARVLMVVASGYQLALPLSDVESALLVESSQGLPSSVVTDGQPLPVEHLGQRIGLPAPASAGRHTPVLVLKSRGRLYARSVDRLVGERDVVLRPLPAALTGVPHLEGAVSLGDGTVAFLLEAGRLVSDASADSAEPRSRAGTRPRIIVADDSVTTRLVHRQSLLAEGFEVQTATDGEEALRILEAQGADLIVSDVRMPHLDGLGLTRRVRAHHLYGRLPVVLVSSLDADADRERALDAGATEYIAKGAYVRTNLVRVVRALLQLDTPAGSTEES